jgi:hypothetical protein
VDLAFWANVAEVLGTITIVGGLFFGLVQLREYRRQREETVAGELMRSFYDAHLADAVALLYPERDDLSESDLKALGPEYLQAAIKVAMTFETMGLLVYRRIAPFDLTLELVGGLVQVLWRKLGRYVRAERERQSHPAFAEWFEWLAVKSAEHKPHSIPAYERGADWRP